MNFLQDITLGQFLPGTSLLHRLDPRTKFIALILLMGMAFLIRSLWALALLAGLSGVVLLLSGLPPGYVLRGMRPFLWIILLTAVIHLATTPGSSLPFFPLGFVDLTVTGAEKGLLSAGQLFLALFLSSLFTLTTSPLQLAHGLEKLISPLRRFRVPVEDFSLMTMLAVKFIPILLGEANRIIKAQSARGVDFESGNFIRRARNLVPILTPLFHSVFNRAEELAMAMLARGYVSGARRTHLHPLRMQARDYFVLAGLAGFAILEMGVLN
ncbi:MAG: energy-coupling factor transporter transmembrane protein EcfT [Deltaproteobacteria bacterium]|nr:energy-coupling factor transporter transmembrane protein EcfT [Deltaproteobacteria bacterium]